MQAAPIPNSRRFISRSNRKDSTDAESTTQSNSIRVAARVRRPLVRIGCKGVGQRSPSDDNPADGLDVTAHGRSQGVLGRESPHGLTVHVVRERAYRQDSA